MSSLEKIISDPANDCKGFCEGRAEKIKIIVDTGGVICFNGCVIRSNLNHFPACEARIFASNGKTVSQPCRLDFLNCDTGYENRIN